MNFYNKSQLISFNSEQLSLENEMKNIKKSVIHYDTLNQYDFNMYHIMSEIWIKIY